MKNVHKSSGFTLIEMLLALGVLSILATIVIPRYQCHLKNARYASAVKDLSATRDMIELFEIETGSWPDSLETVFAGRAVPRTLEYCVDSGDKDAGHGNEECTFFDEDNPSGQNNHGGTPAIGYLLNIKRGYQRCNRPEGEFYYVHCCGMNMITGDPDQKLGHPGNKK